MASNTPNWRTAKAKDFVWAAIDGEWRPGQLGTVRERGANVSVSMRGTRQTPRHATVEVPWAMLRWRNSRLNGADKPIEAAPADEVGA